MSYKKLQQRGGSITLCASYSPKTIFVSFSFFNIRVANKVAYSIHCLEPFFHLAELFPSFRGCWFWLHRGKGRRFCKHYVWRIPISITLSQYETFSFSREISIQMPICTILTFHCKTFIWTNQNEHIIHIIVLGRFSKNAYFVSYIFGALLLKDFTSFNTFQTHLLSLKKKKAHMGSIIEKQL